MDGQSPHVFADITTPTSATAKPTSVRHTFITAKNTIFSQHDQGATMASRLEILTLQMKGLNACELEWIKTCAERGLQERVDADSQPPCRLLDLPAELRERIYHFVIINHKKAEDDWDHDIYHAPAIMLSCKQIRAEFMRYGKRILTCRMLLSIDENDDSLEWRPITNQNIINGISTAGESGRTGVVTQYNSVTRAEAEQDLLDWIHHDGNDLPRSEYTGVIMEESWFGSASGDRCCWAYLSKDFLARHL